MLRVDSYNGNKHGAHYRLLRESFSVERAVGLLAWEVTASAARKLSENGANEAVFSYDVLVA